MEPRAYLKERLPLVEGALEAALPGPDEAPASLHAAMRHLLFPGGKRLRPGFAFAGAEAVGGDPARAVPAAVAVELIHTYSLVHDDLPCMDDDALRRGRPTVHVAFGEATAVLAGDALQAAAFGVLAAAASAEEASRRVAAARTLAEASGSRGLVGGQVDDLLLASGAIAADADTVESVHARKSAALIAASIAMGAGLVGAEREALSALGRAGVAIGVAFQIADDLLDAEDEEGSSLVAVLGIEGARARAEELLSAALDELASFGEGAEPLRALARYAVRRSD